MLPAAILHLGDSCKRSGHFKGEERNEEDGGLEIDRQGIKGLAGKIPIDPVIGNK